MNETIDYVLTREERDALYKTAELKKRNYDDILRLIEITHPHAAPVVRKEIEGALDHFLASMNLDEEAIAADNVGRDPLAFLERSRYEQKRGMVHIKRVYAMHKVLKERGVL